MKHQGGNAPFPVLVGSVISGGADSDVVVKHRCICKLCYDVLQICENVFSTSVLSKGVLKATLNDYNVSPGILSES